MVLKQDRLMFGQQALLLLFDDGTLTLLFGSFEFLLGLLGLALGFVDSELLLPQTLDFPLVFKLTHTSSLGIHLLQSVVLCELL